MKIHSKQSGFTKVKFLILLGILAIIAYVGNSAIKVNRVRGLVDYASLYTEKIETEMNAYFEHKGKFPLDLATAGIQDIQRPIWWDTGKKLTYRITLDQGFLTFEFIDAPPVILGKTLTFKSSVSGDKLIWDSVGGTIKAKYQPSKCKD